MRRRSGDIAIARELKGARFALWKNPENLTNRQQVTLSSIQKTNARLYRAYLLKEQLRQIYRLPAEAAIRLLDEWIAWARRCRLVSFVKLARTITAQRAGIIAAIEHGLSNARVEQVNTQIRLITRRAFGFHSPRRPDRPRDAQPRRPLPTATAVNPAFTNPRQRQETPRCPLLDYGHGWEAACSADRRLTGESKDAGG